MWRQSEIAFEPGLYSNRSARASKRRWVDGNLVRFRDGVPAQVGGWRKLPVSGTAISGRARGIIAWRPNNQSGRLACIGTHSNAYLFDGSVKSDITPTGISGARQDSILGDGFGVGLFGSGAYGTARPVSNNVISATTWSLDMYGEILIGCFSGDGIIRRFQEGTDARLVTLTNAPTASAICVSDERHVFAFGAAGNPRLVMWSDRENPTVWTSLSTNRAGSYEMQSQSPFRVARRVRGQIIAWTDSEVFSFYPLNNSLVYGRETLDQNAGVCGALAATVATQNGGESAYWMGVDCFYMYDGLVRRLNCDLQDYVFDDINLLQRAKFEASTNVEYSEVRFSYCSAGATEIDRCVVYCYENNTWSKANVARLSWLDRKIFLKPLAVDAAGDIYEHEVGDTADGSEMDSFVVSHPITIGVGEQFAELRSFWPDMSADSTGAELTIIGRDYSGADDIVFGPYGFSPSTEKLDLTIATRQIAIKIAGTGGYWEIGVPIVDMQNGGLR